MDHLLDCAFEGRISFGLINVAPRIDHGSIEIFQAVSPQDRRDLAAYLLLERNR